MLHCYTFVFYYLFLIQNDTEFIGVATEITTRMESDLSIDLNRDTNSYERIAGRSYKGNRKFHCQLVVLKESNTNNNTTDHYERKVGEKKL